MNKSKNQSRLNNSIDKVCSYVLIELENLKFISIDFYSFKFRSLLFSKRNIIYLLVWVEFN